MNGDELRTRKGWMKEAEAAGQVADSMEVRLALMARFDSGEMTLPEVQAELARIKRGAKRNGQITRNQAFLGRTA